MLWLHPFRYALLIGSLASNLCLVNEATAMDHHTLMTDDTLTLSQVVILTLENHPDQHLTQALKDQADALQLRGNSLLAGAPTIGLRYEDDFATDDIGSREIEAELDLPLWNWGQRSAGQAVATEAYKVADRQSSSLKLKIAGQIRNNLWRIKLLHVSYLENSKMLKTSKQLLNKIKNRVDFGDLPRADLLLAQSDHLQKRSALMQIAAKLKFAKQNYLNLTQIDRLPANFIESQSAISEILDSHPKLSVINAAVQQKKAALNWIKSSGSGQSHLIFGGKSEKDSETSDDIESLNVEISIPFGGNAHLAPDIAEANLQLTQAKAQRAHIFRLLNQQLQAAKNALQMIQYELKIAQELKDISDSHLKLTQFSYSAGEINLIDLLKVQAISNNAALHATIHRIMWQKKIAEYNQTVGIIP